MQAHLQRPSFIVCAVSHMDCAVSPNRLRGSFQTEHSLLAMVPVIPVIYYGTAVPADCSICLKFSPKECSCSLFLPAHFSDNALSSATTSAMPHKLNMFILVLFCMTSLLCVPTLGARLRTQGLQPREAAQAMPLQQANAQQIRRRAAARVRGEVRVAKSKRSAIP